MGKLIKTQLKNGKFLYETITEEGERIKLRTSNRDYVACTLNGEFFFSRMDLVGKGDHSKQIRDAENADNNLDAHYEKMMRLLKSYGRENEMPDKDTYIAERAAYYRERVKQLTTIITL